MSVFNEIFASELEKVLYDSNAFLGQMKNVSSYLNGKTVHIPQYLTRATIDVNGAVNGYDFSSTATTEQDLTFNLDAYRIRPFTVSNFDEMITNYDKFSAVTDMVIKDMVDFTSLTILNKLSSDIPVSNFIPTTGAVGTNNSADGTADFNKLSYVDFISLQKKFNQDNLPQDGRYLLIDAEMYSEILQDDAIRNAMDFGTATLPSGVVGKIAGINIMVKNQIASLDAANAINPIGHVLDATDKRVGFAWHSSILVTAKSDVKVYTDSENVFKFSNIVSAEQFMSCVNPRNGLDDAGAYLIVQA